jgi:hypothetical protein
VSGVPRSQSLIRILTETANVGTTFTSPAGYVTLVKSLHAFNASASPVLVQMRIYDAGGRLITLPVYQQLASNTPLEWNGWIALNPGDYVYAEVDGPTTGVWVSGAVLAGPNQFPPADG